MAYDLHGGWENKLGHHSQFYNPPHESELFSIEHGINYWLNQGFP